jgi:Na+/melibiose symporter-like transporter
LAIASVIIGTILPPAIYDWGNIQSFALMGAVIFMIGSIAGVAVIYGSREDPARKAQQAREGERSREVFVKSYKKAVSNGLKNKAFVGFILLYFGNKVWDYFVLGNVNYFARWILEINSDLLTVVYVFVILGIFTGVGLFTLISKKIGFYKTAILGGISESICTLPLLFVRDLWVSLPFFFIVGIGNGAMWSMLAPILSEALDSLSIQMKERSSGVYTGIYAFFGRFAIILFTVAMVFIHEMTGFITPDPSKDVTIIQPPAAKFGILITGVLFPVLGTAIFTTLFALVYDIHGEKKEWLQEQLEIHDIGR